MPRPPRRPPARLLRALSLVLLAPLLAGTAECTSSSNCRHIGETCSNSEGCCPTMGLLCDPGPLGAYCSKTCRCRAGTALCTPPSFDEGCPQGSVCLVTGEGGYGQCIVLCNEEPCAPNHYRCGAFGDGGELRCVAVDAGVAGARDGGPADLSATSD